MAYLHDDVLDALLNEVGDNCNRLDITSQEATTYTEAITTYSLGQKLTPAFTGPANGDASGRKITVDAITDGTVDGTDTATHWALVDTGNTKLLSTGALSASEAVTSGNTFTLTAFDIEVTDPT